MGDLPVVPVEEQVYSAVRSASRMRSGNFALFMGQYSTEWVQRAGA
jgi:hypothetical protein